MKNFKIKEKYIHLNQLIKAISWSSNGSEANALIINGLIKVNDSIEYRKRNKLVPGDKIEYNQEIIVIE